MTCYISYFFRDNKVNLFERTADKTAVDYESMNSKSSIKSVANSSANNSREIVVAIQRIGER